MNPGNWKSVGSNRRWTPGLTLGIIFTTMAGLLILAHIVPGDAGSSALADDWDKAQEEKWNRAFMQTVSEGERLFHGPELAGNTVQCAMCHPNATNTHPETYPKFQKQLGKVSTMREMINWCIRNPLQGKELRYDDPKMIAIEAYITYERRSVPLSPGKH